MEKLNKDLLSLQLPLGYLSIMVYSGIEPEKSRRDKASEATELHDFIAFIVFV